MPCYHPLQAWRGTANNIILGATPPRGYKQELQLPCGKCLGCRAATAKAWALRCHLELQNHDHAVFTTLTYDDQHLPPTLTRRHLQLFLKKLRDTRKRNNNTDIRFFGCGEYGEQNGRPHYHIILYGPSVNAARQIDKCWGLGYTLTESITPDRIAYTAGYCHKKIDYAKKPTPRVDPNTGEEYIWQPPFIQMSRRPGIGACAREYYGGKRLYAIDKNGYKQPIPRYFTEYQKTTITQEELEQLQATKRQYALTSHNNTAERREAAEKIAEAKRKQSSKKRKL